MAIKDTSEVIELGNYLLGQNMLFEKGQLDSKGTLSLKSTVRGMAEWKVDY